MKNQLTPETVGPLSRLVDVSNVPPHGLNLRVEATEEECAALARDFKLPAIRALSAEYRVTASAKGVHVAGTVRAAITQICVVTLDPFDSAVEEQVEVDFAEGSGMPAEPPTEMHEYEPPDEIVNGQIDLGALTAEFLALGLDPYPRKPGVNFSFDDGDAQPDSPFTALGRLKDER
jgi:Large ribosomal RNA subunit accumulation protein YceD